MQKNKSKIENKIIYWHDILTLLNNGYLFSYPAHINKKFIYETSVCNKTLTSKYNEKFIVDFSLNKITKQNYEPFIEYIKHSTNNYVTSFYNINGVTKLIIPIKKRNKNFSTMKDFIDNASKTQ